MNWTQAPSTFLRKLMEANHGEELPRYVAGLPAKFPENYH